MEKLIEFPTRKGKSTVLSKFQYGPNLLLTWSPRLVKTSLFAPHDECGLNSSECTIVHEDPEAFAVRVLRVPGLFASACRNSAVTRLGISQGLPGLKRP
eukprot:970700-Prorocentrum_minimum.AAC.2